MIAGRETSRGFGAHAVARAMLWLAAPLLLGAPALAQFDVPASTAVREKITGQLLSAEGAPAPEAGDQIGAFVGDQVVGLFSFTGETATREFVIIIYGDLQTTNDVVEGAKRNEVITFRFFDSSANTDRTDVVVEAPNGERFTYKYAGEEVPPILDDLPIPIDLTPTRTLNLRVGVTGGGGGDGGDGDPVNRFDVDGNGKVQVADAAIVLRIVTGATRGLSEDSLGRADVNDDGVVSSADAIEVLQNR